MTDANRGGRAGTGGGQDKSHVATRTNPATGQVETKTFTQAEWRARDKSEGWVREDGDETDESTDL